MNYPYRHIATTLIRLTNVISLLLFGTIVITLVLWLASLIFSREP